MKKAILIKVINDRQNLYHVDPPIAPYECDDLNALNVRYEFVISSICLEFLVPIQGCPEVYLFPATKNGVMYTELPGSLKGTRDIEEPLRRLGYTITKPPKGFKEKKLPRS